MRDHTAKLFLLLILCERVGVARRRHRHNLRLLSKCLKCGARFKIPALWEQERCDRCRFPFEEIVTAQKLFIYGI